MRLLTVYSPTHRQLFERFLRPSATEFRVVAKRLPQTGNGQYMNRHWLDAMWRKVDFIYRKMWWMRGQVFVFADADVQLFPPVRDFLAHELGDYDMAFQEDVGTQCAGFFVARANARVRQLYATLRAQLREYPNEQTALNDMLDLVKWKSLPRSVFTVGRLTGGEVWDGESLDVPTDLRAHHANYTVGLDNKARLMELVRAAQRPASEAGDAVLENA